MLGEFYPIGSFVQWKRKYSIESGVIVSQRVGKTMFSKETTNQYIIQQDQGGRASTTFWMDEKELTWLKEAGLFRWNNKMGRHVSVNEKE